ncbi:MAG: ATP-binding protein [Chloroherpetonaceae bacterium]|nr:ATP-binding protein [Chthonomonadaceae bacterium]MDW8209316.1 ATP-binding protein [Chloroherpetonaceae bacterium]
MKRHNGDNGLTSRSERVPAQQENGKEIGVIVRGSLREGLEMRLAEGQSVEDLRVGKFVVVEGAQYRYFSMISDVQLAATHPNVLLHPPGREETLLRAVLDGTSVFGTASLTPMLMVPRDAGPEEGESLMPVKTIPVHFSPVYEATREDVGRVFGEEARGTQFFHVGEPLDMDTPVCLNLERWVERSNAIFGKSGTGKTFLTRIVLCGVIRSDCAVNLIFDMHSEYGWTGTSEDRQRGGQVRGLKHYFGNRVQIFTLDPRSTRQRQVRADYEVQIPYSEITVEDILLLERELNLNPTAVETCHLLVQRFGQKQWLREFLNMNSEDLTAFVGDNNAHRGALTALQRKLNVLVRECEGFLKPEVPDDAVPRILQTLQRGVSVVLEFGHYDRPVQYMLVANILTRRLHQIYRDLTERSLGGSEPKPRPLLITIEEAHKFLAPHLSEQTIFGTIAREMRKYNVTLLIVDQRPSGIDPEVLSQVGTRICCLLEDERDVNAALAGVSGASSLRNVLASLETRQQALIFGHAVPMPVVVRTRTYDDEAFRQSMQSASFVQSENTPEDAEAHRARMLALRDQDF